LSAPQNKLSRRQAGCPPEIKFAALIIQHDAVEALGGRGRGIGDVDLVSDGCWKKFMARQQVLGENVLR
jgi:hypothetical protein